jgi:hypothetical protein
MVTITVNGVQHKVQALATPHYSTFYATISSFVVRNSAADWRSAELAPF